MAHILLQPAEGKEQSVELHQVADLDAFQFHPPVLPALAVGGADLNIMVEQPLEVRAVPQEFQFIEHRYLLPFSTESASGMTPLHCGVKVPDVRGIALANWDGRAVHDDTSTCDHQNERRVTVGGSSSGRSHMPQTHSGSNPVRASQYSHNSQYPGCRV